ncbi:MAG: NUDIX domain-containing protein [Sulfurovum sp.]|jgi:8-oxo-dGTP diphosphatase|nr:MAG: Diadenosine hexaphosphate hydrolase [Arcobacter lacus]
MKLNVKEEFICNFNVIVDVYNGITIKSDEVKEDKNIFLENIKELICETKDKYNLIWVYINIEKAEFIKVLTNLDFKFHTCNENRILLVKQQKQNAIIPTASNHTLGVGVVVVNPKNQLLVIKEKISDIGFKLPGGHIDDGEMISSACVREVFEETGIKIEFDGVISLGHFYPHQFDKSNLYILCKGSAITSQINIIDTDEIVDAKWIDVNEYLNDEKVFPYIKEIVKTSLRNDGLVLRNELLNINREFELLFPNDL